jgi:hypothetical protein
MSAQRRARTAILRAFNRQKTQYANAPDTGHSDSTCRFRPAEAAKSSPPRTHTPRAYCVNTSRRERVAVKGLSSAAAARRKQRAPNYTRRRRLHSAVCTCKAERSLSLPLGEPRSPDEEGDAVGLHPHFQCKSRRRPDSTERVRHRRFFAPFRSQLLCEAQKLIYFWVRDVELRVW